MALFRRKKKDEDTAESDALPAEDTGSDGQGEQATVVRSTVEEPAGGGSFISEGGQTEGYAPPAPAAGSRVEPPPEEEEEEESPTATATTAAATTSEPETGVPATPPGTEAVGSEAAMAAIRDEVGAADARAVDTAGGAAAPASASPFPGGPEADAGQSPLEAHSAVEHDPFEQRPEVFVGAAFAGGFLLAQFLKWMGGDDE